MKLKYFLIIFLIVYLLLGLILSIVFIKPDVRIDDEKSRIACKEYQKKCDAWSGCPVGCFGSPVNTLQFLSMPEAYLSVIAWPVWASRGIYHTCRSRLYINPNLKANCFQKFLNPEKYWGPSNYLP